MAYRNGKEDTLPKVIICGVTEENIPKLIVCDASQEKREPRTCLGPCNNQPSPYIPSQQRPPIQPAQASKGPCDMPDNLICAIRNKEQTIDNLQHTLCSLQCEMNCLTQQNKMLKEKLQEIFANENIPCGKDMDCLNSRMHQFNTNTKMLEEQVVTMRSNVKVMRDELLAVRAERSRLENSKNVITICPPGLCCSRPPPCGRK